MVNIKLTNRNLHSSARDVIINIATRMCTFADNQEIELKHLINELGFSHPLITETFTPVADHLYHYEYDDIDGLFHSAIFVYSTLLHVDKPHACKFKIKPSSVFQRSKFADDIYFSIYKDKPAQESISIKQLEGIDSDLAGYKYKFLENVLIDDVFTIADLPSSIDGDMLFTSHLFIIDLLKAPPDLSDYELRYIGPDIGFGVFSRKAIKQGDIVSFYGGVKTTCDLANLSYAYKSDVDCLNMYLDARLFGNITRYINHAPASDTTKKNLSRASLLEANVKAPSYYLNGIEIVVYSARRAIQKGEQLLVDYGTTFFQELQPVRFKKNGQFVNPNKKNIRTTSKKKLNQLRIMAGHGVKKAQYYLRLRMFFIVVVIVLFMGILNRI